MLLNIELKNFFIEASKLNSSLITFVYDNRFQYKINSIFSKFILTHLSSEIKNDSKKLHLIFRNFKNKIYCDIVVTEQILMVSFKGNDRDILIQFGSYYYYIDFIPEVISYSENLYNYLENIKNLNYNLDFDKVLFHFEHSKKICCEYLKDEEFICIGSDLETRIDILNNRERFYKELQNNNLISIQIYEK